MQRRYFAEREMFEMIVTPVQKISRNFCLIVHMLSCVACNLANFLCQPPEFLLRVFGMAGGVCARQESLGTVSIELMH